MSPRWGSFSNDFLFASEFFASTRLAERTETPLHYFTISLHSHFQNNLLVFYVA